MFVKGGVFQLLREHEFNCQCKRCIEKYESSLNDMFPNEENEEELEETLFREWSKDR